MPIFHYHAVNASGQTQSGQIDASTPAAARDELLSHGWQVITFKSVALPGNSLTDVEMGEVALELINATQIALPLPGVLRALAEETASARLKSRIRMACQALEQGQSLSQVLSSYKLGLQPMMAAVLESGLPTSAMTPILMHLLKSMTLSRELKRRAILLLSYPLLMLACLVGLWLFLLTVIVPLYTELLISSTVNSPEQSFLVALSNLLVSFNSKWIAAGAAISLGVGVGIFALVPVRVRTRIWNRIPFTGSIFKLISLSDLAFTLAVLVEHRTHLPKALTLVGQGTADPALGDLCLKIADQIQEGDSLTGIASRRTDIPNYFEQMLRWLEQGQSGSQPLKYLSQMLRLRARMLAESTSTLFEPILICSSIGIAALYLGFGLVALSRMLRLLS